MQRPPKTWKRLVQETVESLPREFTLRDVEKCRAVFEREYPENRFVDAKIRQTLQVLRDQGVIAFLGGGRYRNLAKPPVFSPLIDPSAAAGYVAKQQIARVMIETWAELNLYCINCGQDSLGRLPASTPVADFACGVCAERYQVKSRNGRFGPIVTGAAYAPTVAAIRSRLMPSFVLVEYDTRHATVVFVHAVPGNRIGESRVSARKELRAGTRRSGWVGCTIRIADLPSVRLVEPSGVARDDVRARWQALTAEP